MLDRGVSLMPLTFLKAAVLALGPATSLSESSIWDWRSMFVILRARFGTDESGEGVSDLGGGPSSRAGARAGNLKPSRGFRAGVIGVLGVSMGVEGPVDAPLARRAGN